MDNTLEWIAYKFILLTINWVDVFTNIYFEDFLQVKITNSVSSKQFVRKGDLGEFQWF